MVTLKLGQRVALARTFLKSAGLQVGEYGFLRGAITNITSLSPRPGGGTTVVTVLWDSGDEQKAVPSALWDADKLYVEDR